MRAFTLSSISLLCCGTLTLAQLDKRAASYAAYAGYSAAPAYSAAGSVAPAYSAAGGYGGYSAGGSLAPAYSAAGGYNGYSAAGSVAPAYSGGGYGSYSAAGSAAPAYSGYGSAAPAASGSAPAQYSNAASVQPAGSGSPSAAGQCLIAREDRVHSLTPHIAPPYGQTGGATPVTTSASASYTAFAQQTGTSGAMRMGVNAAGVAVMGLGVLLL